MGLLAQIPQRRLALQAPASGVGPYVLDFYCAVARFAVEIDGAQHDLPEQIAHDMRRDAWLETRGIHVMRIAAADILNDCALEGVLVMIAEAARSRLRSRE